MIEVSVVVPTYRRPDLLRRCLAALIAQRFPSSRFEVIVADNAASEETRKTVAEWSGRSPEIRYVPAARVRGPAAARNDGWRAARGAVIAFTDDDCVPDLDWLAAGCAALGDGVAAARGKVVMPLPPVPTDYERNESGLQTAEFVTANCFCRRDALEAVGGFDERFTDAWREDSDLFFAFLERGLEVRCVPEAVVVHPVRPAPWGISLKQQAKSRFNALLYKKHPRLYRERIQPRPPWNYYAIFATAAISLGAMVVGQPILAMASAFAWGLLTTHFLWRRLKGTAHTVSHIAEMVATSVLIPPLAIYWRLRGAFTYRVPFL